jgi:peptidoglycan hydrolase-like protein with peptidoglycan-binding domain
MGEQKRDLSLRMQGEDVTNLQKWLKLLGFHVEGKEGYFGKTTRAAIQEFQKQHGLEPTGVVDKKTLELILAEIEGLKPEPPQPQYRVTGTVKDKAGNPVAEFMVKAFNRYLRQETLLGSGKTDDQGVYALSFSPSGKEIINVVIKIYGPKEALLYQSAVVYNISGEVKIDVELPAVYPGYSEFERIARALTPLLTKGMAFADLERDDISFLAGRTGIEADKIARLSLAHRLSNDSKMQPEFWYATLILSFYEKADNLSLQKQFDNIRASLPSLDGAAVRKAIMGAVTAHVIPSVDDKQVDQFIDQFLKYSALQSISTQDGQAKPFVRQALEDAGITGDAKQMKFSELFNKYRGFTPELAEELKKDKSFNAVEIASVETSFRLADVTKSDFPVVKVIKNEFNVQQPEAIRGLAKKSEKEWIDVVNKGVRSGEISLPVDSELEAVPKINTAEIYGKQLARQFQEAFPTTAFCGGLERALESGQKPALQHAQDITKLFNDSPEFELLNTPVDSLPGLDTHNDPHPELKEPLRTELKALQRVFKLAPSYDASNALLADNLHSARQVYARGESQFVREYKDKPGFDERTARTIWNRAADTHAATLSLVGELQAMAAAGAIASLNQGNEAVSSFPNWDNFFRTGDNCECDYYRSVLSPAAYFADLLMFLRDRKSKKPSLSVKDILFNRRPDLGYLELNRENALTTLPYIDVVCEVLENAVVPGADSLDFDTLTAISSDMGQAMSDVRAAFHSKGVSLGSDFALVQVGATEDWVVHDESAVYLLKKNATHYVAERLRNTKAGADELRANPQYVISQAYETLRTAKYPFALPFDLFGAEVRVLLQRAGIKRWELMQIFRDASSNSPSDGDIAAEYFGISVDEKRIITEENTDGQYEFWGEVSNSSLTAGPVNNQLTSNPLNVKIFLQRTGLEFNDLLTLLDLKFIQSQGNIHIDHLDATCDTGQKQIDTLDVAGFDRINRFLRLWRKLAGWKMWELDLVIRHPKIGNGQLNEDFLIQLMHLAELKNRLSKASVEQLCSLFGDINWETHFTKPYEPREDALYQNLFLNKRLIHPIDPAFEVTNLQVDLNDPNNTITAHQSVVTAALRIKESELTLYRELTKASDATKYIDDQLTLNNLSFLYRHFWLAKQLKYKATEWQILLKLFNQDMADFGTPASLKSFVEKVEALRQTGFTIDELDYLFTADKSTKSAMTDAAITSLLSSVRKELLAAGAEYDVAKYPFLDSPEATDVGQLTALLTTLLQKLNRGEEGISTILASISSGNLDLQTKFYEPVFKASLRRLPAEVDFKNQLTPELSAKITFDAEQQLLIFNGVMQPLEHDALSALSSELIEAVDSLFNQPQNGNFPDDQLWLKASDLLTPDDDENVAKNLATACQKLLAYMQRTSGESTVVQLFSDQLGLTRATVTELIVNFQLTGQDSIFKQLNDSDDLVALFADCRWLERVSLILKKWKIRLDELKWLIAHQNPLQPGGAGTIDLDSLVVSDAQPVAPMEPFIRTYKLLGFRERFDETQVSLMEVLDKLSSNVYSEIKLEGDVNLLSAWDTGTIDGLITSLDLTYPADFLPVENWERLGKAMSLLVKLNADAATMKKFAKPTVDLNDSAALKQLLRTKYGVESWLTLSTEIQDTLRERKRDALVAWLLAQPRSDPPSGKWEDSNDVYAYYLLDVEMSSCMLTSRLVQASGSVQLFVQRCMMGLEPDVTVDADGDDGDSAWRWWKWMRKYRVWEANRKVFLFPENWIEPELRKDKSSFFKDLENELLQNDVDQYTVETAFLNYLEKLDGVSQLEIAGFYHEDDADLTFMHVFGRTKGAEPHVYYYRQYDYRRWTPWEKVDLEIAGDYLIPAVINKRLFLFWPVFTEVPDEQGNKTVTTPEAATPYTVPETKKKLRLQMAVSEYRNGKWTPKKVSVDAFETAAYVGEMKNKYFEFWPIDRSEIDGRFAITFAGFYMAWLSGENHQEWLKGSFEIFGCKGIPEKSDVPGEFKHYIVPDRVETPTECMKYIEVSVQTNKRDDFSFIVDGSSKTPSYARALQSVITVLDLTPPLFKIAMTWHPSFFDRLLIDSTLALRYQSDQAPQFSIGTWLPFFYADKHRTFFALPVYPEVKPVYPVVEPPYPAAQLVALAGTIEKQFILSYHYYPELKTEFKNLIDSGERDYRLQLQQKKPGLSSEEIELYVRNYMQWWNTQLVYLNLQLFATRKFHFKNFYYPFACDFVRLVSNPLKGISALMRRQTQLKNTGFSFFGMYKPTAAVMELGKEDYYPREEVDFSPDGSYSCYNWELFFHIPLMIAIRLSKNQQFEEAMKWFHYIFNPIGVEGTLPDGTPAAAPQKYWITKPFFLTTNAEYKQQRIDSILRMLAGDDTVEGYTAALKNELIDQVLDWRYNPFEPHRIAQYRTVAYQKTTVMKYIDNFIAWGDNLFRQDSMESINEATQLYVLSAEILGPRPKNIPPQAKPVVETYNELESHIDSFANSLVQVENLIPMMPGNSQDGDAAPLPLLYFSIPQNENLLTYWDTVADRLYKIRHGMNIEGVKRQLALFEPPIDPAALVKAVAAGIDIGAALADLMAPLPLYRFNVLLQKANEFCSDVKALGNALLSALEKKDAEALSLLRQSQEITLLNAVTAIKEKQIEEAKTNLEAVKWSKAVTEIRRNYYRDIENLSTQEKLQLDKMGEAHRLQELVQAGKLAASIISIMPAIDLGLSGFGGSPIAKAKLGGLELGQAANLAADILSFKSMTASNDSAMASSKASFDRRWDDWKLQERMADKELEQFDKQIASAELRVAIAEKELENHLIQVENAADMEDFLKSKFTNQELYQWMVGEVSRVYFQSYQLAYEMAKRAERCYCFELGIKDSNYIQFGYWDNLKKGLLAGDKLQYDLRRLEADYLDNNSREFELTKHISLAMLDPLAMMKLKTTGRCFFSLPEEAFDLDYPGHYFRRIKSVSITLPCITGPYTTVSCTLRLLKNYVRTETGTPDGYEHASDADGVWADDDRFAENNIPVKAIAASSAQNDSGLFELNFHDERYMPFEGAGVIGDWALELFYDSTNNVDFGEPLRQFDYDTISDAIIHVKYTAREDAGPFKNLAIQHLRDYFWEQNTPCLRMFNLRQDFPNEWYRLLNPENAADGNVFDLVLNKNHFPYKDSGHQLQVNAIVMLARCSDTRDYEITCTPSCQPDSPSPWSLSFTLAKSPDFGNLHFARIDNLEDNIILDLGTTNEWTLTVRAPTKNNIELNDHTKNNLGPNEMEDLIVILGYQWVKSA